MNTPLSPTTGSDTQQPPSTHFEPQNNDALWQLVNSPHPVVGSAKHLGEALVNAGMVLSTTIDDALQLQRHERERGVRRQLGQILVELGSVTQDQLRQVIATWLGDYVVNPGMLHPDAAALALVPRLLAERESVPA